METDETLTFEIRGILRLLSRPGTAEKVALCEGRSLRRVRADLEELERAGLVTRVAGGYRTTARGDEAARVAPRMDPIC